MTNYNQLPADEIGGIVQPDEAICRLLLMYVELRQREDDARARRQLVTAELAEIMRERDTVAGLATWHAAEPVRRAPLGKVEAFAEAQPDLADKYFPAYNRRLWLIDEDAVAKWLREYAE